MKITSITVDAGRTFNHPHESYSNLRPSVTLTATIEEGDNPDECAKSLQARAEELVENHKQHLLESLNRLNELSMIERETNSLEQSIKNSQSRLTFLREQKEILDCDMVQGLSDGTGSHA